MYFFFNEIIPPFPMFLGDDLTNQLKATGIIFWNYKREHEMWEFQKQTI